MTQEDEHGNVVLHTGAQLFMATEAGKVVAFRVWEYTYGRDGLTVTLLDETSYKAKVLQESN